MKVAVLLGSVRPGADVMGPYGRLSNAVGDALKEDLEAAGAEVYVLDPLVLRLPLMERAYHHYGPNELRPESLQVLYDTVKASHAIVTVCGEYNHGVPPALKNLLDYLPREAYDKKPAGIVTYSPGPFGGSMAAVQLRSVLPELGMVSVPTLLRISNANAELVGNGQAKWREASRGTFVPELLFYARALKSAGVEQQQ
jgi:NAD(P)H-dependent FMN reductase